MCCSHRPSWDTSLPSNSRWADIFQEIVEYLYIYLHLIFSLYSVVSKCEFISFGNRCALFLFTLCIVPTVFGIFWVAFFYFSCGIRKCLRCWEKPKTELNWLTFPRFNSKSLFNWYCSISTTSCVHKQLFANHLALIPKKRMIFIISYCFCCSQIHQ